MTLNDLPEPIRVGLQAGFESFVTGRRSRHAFTQYVAHHPDTDQDAFEKGWALADACDFIRYCDTADWKLATADYTRAVDAINSKYEDVAVTLEEALATSTLGDATKPGTFAFGFRTG